MKTLTLTQPWASLVALGAKRIETRSWMTSYRGPLAIHAAKGLRPVGGIHGLIDVCAEEPFRSALATAGIWKGGVRKDRLPLGAIVAVCQLVGCYPTARTDGSDGSRPAYCTHAGRQHGDRRLVIVEGDELAFGDYSPGRYAWLLADVRALPTPIPCAGALGLWDVPAPLLAQLEGLL